MFRRNTVTATGYAFGYVLAFPSESSPNVPSLLCRPAPVLVTVDSVGDLLVGPATLLLQSVQADALGNRSVHRLPPEPVGGPSRHYQA